MNAASTDRKGVFAPTPAHVPYEIRRIDDSRDGLATKLRGYKDVVVAAAERGDEVTVELARNRQLELLKKEFDCILQRKDSKNFDSALEVLSQMESLDRLLSGPEAARANKEERLIALNKKDSYLRSERVKEQHRKRVPHLQEETQA
ncbi:MAG: hypothetical protein LVQ95_00820 [Candidatus Micrarchaeales archaeon]|nr:hypothetical protein [Candidatus Micrarchaeales archaeon]